MNYKWYENKNTYLKDRPNDRVAIIGLMMHSSFWQLLALFVSPWFWFGFGYFWIALFIVAYLDITRND